jgi:predicted nucleic acid-binding protein
MDRCVADDTAIISFQVVQEVLNTVTQKFNPPYDADQSRFLLDRILVPIWRIAPSQSLYELGIEMRARYKYHFYDSLIIAAAVSSGCTRLYTEDMQHGQRIEQLTIVNPFA